MHYPTTVVPLDVARACFHAGLGRPTGACPWSTADQMVWGRSEITVQNLGQGTLLSHEEGLVVTLELLIEGPDTWCARPLGETRVSPEHGHANRSNIQVPQQRHYS